VIEPEVVPGEPGFPEGGPELGWEELFPDWFSNLMDNMPLPILP